MGKPMENAVAKFTNIPARVPIFGQNVLSSIHIWLVMFP